MELAHVVTAKRIKVDSGELEFSSSPVRLGGLCREEVGPVKSVLPETSENSGQPTVSRDPCSSPGSDHAPASCCSSNAGSNLVKGSLKVVDLEDDSAQLETSTCVFDCSESRETSPSEKSGELESTATSSEANSRHGSPAEEMPSEAELEEFFVAAEKELQKQFAEKYNFDIAEDKPLEGRYEWIRLKP